MASTQEILVPELSRCYHCGVESTDNTFKYLDNKKVDQPRYQCHNCHKLFTKGTHGRPQGKTYAKKRNEDPVELKSLSRQCRHCGVADNAVFKYYNNNSILQPRFQCLSCGNQFQMRVMGLGEETHLVHTSSKHQSAPRRRKQGVPKPFPNASSSSEDGSYQPCDGSFLPVPFDSLMPLELGARLLPEMSSEDVQYSSFLEAELAQEENQEANFTSGTDNNDNGTLPLSLSGEGAQYSDFFGADLLAEECYEALNDGAFPCVANVDEAWPPAWSNEDVELMDFMEASVRDNESPCPALVSNNVAEMVSESTSNNVEVMYGTLELESLAETGSEPWTHNDKSMDPYNMTYADAAAACCRELDLDMAIENSKESLTPMQPNSSSSSVGSTNMFAHPFGVIPEPDLLQQASTEDEQCSDFQWNEGEVVEDNMEMASWTY